MPSNPEELEQALIKFRLDVVAALTDLKLEINSLEAALIDQNVLDNGDLNEARATEKNRRDQVRRHFYETIGPAHEVREFDS